MNYDILILVFSIIIILKSIVRIYSYKKTSKTVNFGYSEKFSNPAIKENFVKYRLCAILIWLTFLAVCCFFKFVLHFSDHWYIFGSYLLLIADVVFYSKFCLLNKIINYFAKTNISCCFMCPIRGWDIAMFVSPGIFFIGQACYICKIFTAIAFVLGVTVLMLWEKYKFRFLCDIPNHKLCQRKCGAEYICCHTCKRKTTKHN